MSLFGIVCTLGFQNCSKFAVAQLGIENTSLSSSISQDITCTPTLQGTSELPIRRLDKDEIIASLRVLFGDAIVNDANVQANLSKIPDQTPSALEFDNSIVDVVGLESVASSIADALVNNSSAFQTAIGSCDLSNASSCATPIVKNFAPLAFRRPLASDVEQSISSLVTQTGGTDGIKSGIIRVLTSPYFTQKIELGENADNCTTDCPAANVTDGRFKLSQYEIASRLSFELTGAAPDRTLFAAAAAGQLADLGSIRSQAQRLMGTSGARLKWRKNVSRWLGLKPGADPATVVAAAAGISASGFGQEAAEELLRFAEYEVFDKKSTLRILLTESIALPYTDRLAKVFGVSRSDGPVTLANGSGGLLLRPSTLLNTGVVSNPILRGTQMQKNILCNSIPLPDQSFLQEQIADEAALDHTVASNRDLISNMTSRSSCTSCHQQINPIGFALEGYGPLGVPRSTETVFGSQGNVVATHPINTSVSDLKIDPSVAIPADDAADFALSVANNDRTRICFGQTLVALVKDRPADASDGCGLSQLNNAQKLQTSVLDSLIDNTVNDGIFWRTAKGIQ